MQSGLKTSWANQYQQTSLFRSTTDNKGVVAIEIRDNFIPSEHANFNTEAVNLSENEDILNI